MADVQREQVREDLLSQARTVSADIGREIAGEVEKLQGLAASPSLRQGDFAAFQRQAEAALSVRYGGNIMLVDRSMEQLVNTWVRFGTPMPKVVVQEPVERAFATGRPQFTGLFMGPVNQQLLFPSSCQWRSTVRIVTPSSVRPTAGRSPTWSPRRDYRRAGRRW